MVRRTEHQYVWQRHGSAEVGLINEADLVLKQFLGYLVGKRHVGLTALNLHEHFGTEGCAYGHFVGHIKHGTHIEAKSHVSGTFKINRSRSDPVEQWVSLTCEHAHDREHLINIIGTHQSLVEVHCAPCNHQTGTYGQSRSNTP